MAEAVMVVVGSIRILGWWTGLKARKTLAPIPCQSCTKATWLYASWSSPLSTSSTATIAARLLCAAL